MAEVEDKDLGWKQLFTQFTSSKETRVLVGLLRSAGEHKSGNGGKPISVAQLGAIHEFGAPGAGIPERSFMRTAVDEGRSKLNKLVDKLAKMVVDGDANEEKALGILGETVKNMMKAKIRSGLKPPNSPATIRRKGSSKPLIDTGQLINSINWEVMKGGK